MFRLLAGGARIIGLALMGLVGVVLVWPWQSLAVLAVFIPFSVFTVVHHRKTHSQRVLAMDIKSMSPIEYENYCCALLQQAGWSAKVVGRQGDQGVDVLAALRHTGAAVQCKKYTRRVGNSAVQEIVAGKRHYGAHIGVVVSPVGYTRSAQQLAKSNSVLLLNHSDLSRLEALARVP